ncbi:MAG TPA: hypothetical protein VHG91_07830, partial [Longimicrobium sp.]|nr:hypothetical protein [Longimicrobium sp.]
LAAGGGVPQLHVERFGTGAAPGTRHVLRVANDGATAAEIRVGGVVVVSRMEFGRAGGSLSRELALDGDVTLEATVEGATGTGIVVSIVREPNPTFVVYDEHRFARDPAVPVVETARFVVPPSAGAPVALHVRNGNADGTARVTSAVVRINGTQVFGGDDFNPEIGTLSRVFVPRAGENVVEFALKGQPGTFLSVWVTATDTTPPALEITAPAPGLVTNRTEIAASGRVLDQTLTRVTVNGEPAARQGDAYTATVPLASEGENTIRFTAVDAAGNRTDSVRVVVRDTEAPVVTLESPADGFVTKLPGVTVRGTVRDGGAVTASVNGVPVTPDAAGAFAVDVPLSEGLNYIALTATDAAGNATSVARQVTLDTQAPAIVLAEPAEGAETDADTVAVRGSVSDVTPVRVEIDGAEVQVTPTGTFGGAVALQVGQNTITVTATDAAGNTATATRSVTRRQAGPRLPPDPAKVAPAVDPTVPTTMAAATAFLYTGADPIQTGVAPGTIEPVRAAVVRGRVLDRDGRPLPGVTVSIAGRPELGRTLSRADGAFDLAVNGGGLLFVDYRKDGYLPSQRRVDVPWRQYARADDVALVAVDPVVTRIEMDPAGTEAQVARASVASDDDGARQATLVFQPGTEAVLEMPDGTTRPMGSIAVRATEFTVGEGGLRAMPGTLPPTTAYTYAAELSADEALAAGAEHVRFSKPVPFYLENFLDLPAGMPLPLGVFDPSCGCWIPEPDGRVVQVVSVAGGMAELDVTGDGAADGAAVLAGLGVTDAERAKLATLYTAGQRLWRVPMRHFSAIDINLPEEPDTGGDGDDEPEEEPQEEDEEPDDPCNQTGSSWIACEARSLGESLPLAGTPYALVYQSSRVPGRAAARTIDVPLTAASVNPGLKRVELVVEVAGRRIERSFAPAPGLRTEVTWDGLDAYGRPVQGAQTATVRVGYVYDGVYQVPPARAASFGLPSGVPGTIPTRREVVRTRVATLAVGAVGAPSQGVGGWSLNVHHTYDPNARVLYRGDGTKAGADAVRTTVSRVAGSGFQGVSGDGGAATSATLSFPRKIAFGPDGSLYIADNSNARVRRVTPDGRMTTAAGGGTLFGDNIPATQARLSGPSGLAVGPDGSLYIADSGARKVYRVSPDGIITTVAGTGGSGYSGDGGPATQATLIAPHAIAVGPDCSIYIAEITGHRIRRIGPDGIITTVAGTGVNGATGDGGPATQARIGQPLSVSVGPDGALYFSDYAGSFQPGRVRRVGLDGIITTVAGGGSRAAAEGVRATEAVLFVPGHATLAPDGTLFVLEQGGGQFSSFTGNRVWRVGADGLLSLHAGTGTFCRYQAGSQSCGDGEAPTRAQVSEPYGMAVGPDGALYVVERSNHLVRRIAPTLPGFSGGTLLLAAEGGTELYETDLAGRHLRTLDALTGAPRFTFGYDAAGRLVRV